MENVFVGIEGVSGAALIRRDKVLFALVDKKSFKIKIAFIEQEEELTLTFDNLASLEKATEIIAGGR